MTPTKEPVGELAAAVAATLSGERVANRLTFEQLAQLSGIPARTLKYYIPERDLPQREMKLGQIDKIAQALGLTLQEALDLAIARLQAGAGGTRRRGLRHLAVT